MNNINNNVLYLCKDLEGVNFIKLINHNDYINNKLNKKISFIIEYTLCITSSFGNIEER